MNFNYRNKLSREFQNFDLFSGETNVSSSGFTVASQTGNSVSLPGTSSEGTEGWPKYKKRNTGRGTDRTLDSYLVKSTLLQKMSLDKQVARFIFATNTSFRSVDHPEFIKLVQDLRPGYIPPTRKDISGHLLDTIHEEEKLKCSTILNGQMVCLGLDGWSNVHNEPIICATITTKTGDVYLIDTIDTSGHAHTAEYLAEVAIESIKNCQNNFKCIVRSVVTDNAANVTKMRLLLQSRTDLNVITYGCSAHVLNLLANDFQYSSIKEQIMKVIKYFRNNHFANACYRSTGALKLILPSEVRWNSILDSLESYTKAWSVILKICDEHQDAIDKTIQNIVSNIGLKRNVDDMINQLKPISCALDKIQKNNCTLSDCVFIWKELGEKINSTKNKEVIQKYKNRYCMALTATHFLSYMLDPREKASAHELTQEEKTSAFDFAKSKYPALLPLIIKFNAKSTPFHEPYFDSDITSCVTPYEWWKSQKEEIDTFNNTLFSNIEQLLTAQATSASVERVFSSFGLVHSKLRNRLGTDKAAKLVFLFKIFNKDTKSAE